MVALIRPMSLGRDRGWLGRGVHSSAQVHALRNSLSARPQVDVPLVHATVEFKSERLYTLDGKPAPSPWGPHDGHHKTSDGYVRVHDSFSNHGYGTLELVGLSKNATREELSKQIACWACIDLESVSTAEGKLPQSRAISNFPININPIVPSTPIEMSRVIAAPLCSKTLAAHGVIWITSPKLSDLPTIDRDFSRGKRTVHIDIHNPADKTRLLELLHTADVFVQELCLGALASYGLSIENIIKIRPFIIIANMSAFGPRGPRSGRQRFDSLVLTCSGMNISEAEYAGTGAVAPPIPCQALDHAGGYLLAAGVIAAVYRRAMASGDTGAWRVNVSLAGIMKYLRSLGRYAGATGFVAIRDYENPSDVSPEFFEPRDTGFGPMQAIRHSAIIEGVRVGWDIMPKPLGLDKAEWL
ncbi:CoA-transferase family III domain-containing protein [Xylaria arbuscula]|nr:CoA-transferase family III domain-containing protein [Xylaria arbuscula]